MEIGCWLFSGNTKNLFSLLCNPRDCGLRGRPTTTTTTTSSNGLLLLLFKCRALLGILMTTNDGIYIYNWRFSHGGIHSLWRLNVIKRVCIRFRLSTAKCLQQKRIKKSSRYACRIQCLNKLFLIAFQTAS